MTNPSLSIPSSYRPVERIVFCSNKLIGVTYLIQNNGFIPLLIGKGAFPKIWVFVKDPQLKQLLIIGNSISHHSSFSVDINDDQRKILIWYIDKASKVLVLSVDYRSPTEYVVDELDLRPIGYNIHGNDRGLTVGNNTVSRNQLEGVNTFLGLGSK